MQQSPTSRVPPRDISWWSAAKTVLAGEDPDIGNYSSRRVKSLVLFCCSSWPILFYFAIAIALGTTHGSNPYLLGTIFVVTWLALWIASAIIVSRFKRKLALGGFTSNRQAGKPLYR